MIDHQIAEEKVLDHMRNHCKEVDVNVESSETALIFGFYFGPCFHVSGFAKWKDPRDRDYLFSFRVGENGIVTPLSWGARSVPPGVAAPCPTGSL